MKKNPQIPNKSTYTQPTEKCPFMDINKIIPSKISANINQATTESTICHNQVKLCKDRA